jgi:hypothetical protein
MNNDTRNIATPTIERPSKVIEVSRTLSGLLEHIPGVPKYHRFAFGIDRASIEKARSSVALIVARELLLFDKRISQFFHLLINV